MFNSIFDKFKEAKYFKETKDFKSMIMWNILKK